MQVHEAAALVLGDLRVRHAHELPQPLVGHPGQPGKHARQVDRGAAPEFRKRVVPDHRSGVVEAVRADRLAQAQVVFAVHLAAGQPDAVLAGRRVPAWAAAPRPAVWANASRVHEPEAGRREGDEQSRVLDHGVGHTFATAQSGGDQLVGVAAVALRAGRADRLAAVPARLPEHPVGLAVRRPHPPPTLAVARLDPTAEQDGTGAVAEERSCASNRG